MSELTRDWQPSKLGTGVSVKVLRRDAETGGLTVLLRFEPGATFPAHRHPAGEEVFVVEGQVRIGRDRLSRGDYLYTEPQGVHAVSSESGGIILVMLPKPVEIMKDSATTERAGTSGSDAAVAADSMHVPSPLTTPPQRHTLPAH
jgi:quercetin dioxygenase-like cupin family protein